MEKKTQKRRSPLLIAFFILIGITLILCAAVFGLWVHGRNSLSQAAEAPVLPQVQTSEEPSGDFVEYKGTRYRYNENMRNILLLGIDSDEMPSSTAKSDDQADVLVLAALNLDSNQMTLISVSRDTMCDIAILEDDQHLQGVAHTQIALSYAYGDGLNVSCELCREAVSTLFRGLEIDGYGAFFLGGLSKLNDVLGGVTVTVPEDLPFEMAAFRGMTPGGTVTLTGDQARAFIQWREEDAAGNDSRMQRQKQFLLSAISQLRQQIRSNPASVLSIYNAVSGYVLTDLDLSRIAYLATEAAGMDFSGDILRVPTGEGTVSADQHLELPVDEEGLNDLILSVFYEELTPDAE